MLARPRTGLMLVVFTMARLRQDLATLSPALCFPTLLRRIMIAARAVAITTDCRPRWIGGTATVSRTEWPTPGQSPSTLEAMDISVLKAGFRRTPITRNSMTGLCQDLI